jgi:hypothetical protein
MNIVDVSGGSTDPYVYRNDGSHIEYTNTTGRTRFDPRLASGERTAVFIVAGQSNGSNYVSGTGNLYTPASAKVQNLLFSNGGIYDARDPMLGNDNTGGSWLGRLGDKLITDGIYDRVIFIPVAVGGSSVVSWLPPTGKDSEYLYVAFRRAASVGLSVTAVLWQQGEADNANGMGSSAYADNLNAVIAGVRSEGWSAPWLLAKSTWYLGGPSVAIRAGVDAVVNNLDILPGPDTDTLNNTYRAIDQTHFLASGAVVASQLWAAAIQAAALPALEG